ncbi:MAG: chemotaxis response regulator protein-glutamate methylesterase [Opitutales bacterium]|nr:chemotaxis response regulator protein-glutamate methylesterase [Opitutales bacterium]
MASEKIKVLIVDDSLVVRRMLSRILSEDPMIEVVGTAEDPYDAEGKILQLNPDVLTLDIEMPKMDGLTFLKILMEKRPMPVIVMSSLSQAGSSYAMDALQYGAVEVLAKPYGPYSVGGVGAQLVDKVKAAAASRKRIGILKRSFASASAAARAKPAATGAAPAAPISPAVPAAPPARFHSRQLIALGASTGGTEALKEVLIALPADMPPIVIVQHIPPYFSKAFADRLNGLCALSVKEAEEGDLAKPGTALVAPGDFHMVVQWGTKGYQVSLKKGPQVWHQRPAVDILFKTAAEAAGKYCIGALFTGMGRDGAEGLLAIKNKGCMTFAQDEASCVVYGMPKAAVELGAAVKVAPLDKIAGLLREASLSGRGPGV